MIKLLINLALLFVVGVLIRRTVMRWLLPKSEPKRPDPTPRPEKKSDLGRGQKIEEADYEDLP